MFDKSFSENRAVYCIMLSKYGKTGQATDDNVIWRMRLACWITKATDGYRHTLEICNTYCFPTEQLLRERESMLRYTYITCQNRDNTNLFITVTLNAGESQ
jgi:hypothetical protein